MPTITNPVLTLTRHAAQQTVQCKVTATVTFNGFEQIQMQHGLRFRLRCSLWGKDIHEAPLSTDDSLFVYNQVKYFPDGTPTPNETVVFDDILAQGLLNEDPNVLGNLIDEVYAQLKLTDLTTGGVLTVPTNVCTGIF
jgi:hypothetical protein